MRLERHLYNHEKLVIGGCLSSLLYSYYNNLPILFTQPKPPFIFDEVAIRNPEHFGFQNKAKIPQIFLWEKLMFYQSLQGKVFGSDLIRSIRVEDGNLLKLTTEFSRMIKTQFSELIVFDSEQVSGLTNAPNLLNTAHTVIDWYNVRHGSKHDKTYLYYDDPFINEVWFYKSKRSSYQDRKDCVVRSYLTQDQILSDDYTETISRIKLRRLLKEQIVTKTIVLEHAGRDIYYEYELAEPSETNVVYKLEKPQQILDTYQELSIKPKKYYVELFSSGRDSSSSF
jgi:hypothetical protein